MSVEDFLVEIGTEELPPKALKTLGLAFKSGIETGLEKEGLEFEAISWFASPRRLAVRVSSLAAAQADKNVEKYGPAVRAAFDEQGNPTPAAIGFARSCNCEVENLEKGDKDGVTKLLYRSFEQGNQTISLLEPIVELALAKLPVPKRMRWGSSKIEFVRPVHWVVMLFGNQIVDVNICRFVSGNGCARKRAEFLE